MDKQYKEWLQEQTFETLATDNYNIKLLLLAEQTKNKKLVEALEKIAYRDITIKSNFYSSTVANEALNEVNNAK